MVDQTRRCAALTRIDFYLLADADPGARARFACRLAHRAWRDGHSVLLHTPDAASAASLDELLWQYPDGAFIPHGIAGGDEIHGAPVGIGHGADVGEYHDVLINLDDEVPLFFGRFERLAEIIVQDADARSQGRARYRFYRDRGYPLHHHEIN